MNIGVHCSISGGLVNAPIEAVGLGCTTFQIFSKSPRSWGETPLLPEDIEAFKTAVQKANIFPVVVHTSYLINLASENDDLLNKSVVAFASEIKRAEMIGADYISTHIGSCGDCDKKPALDRILPAIKKAVKLSGTEKVMILFENSAKKSSPGGVFSDLGYLVKACGDRYGITLDTCHAFAAGYDLREKEGCDACIKEVEASAGPGKIKVVHLNDSKGELASGLDRHEHLGKGTLGKKGISQIVNHPKLRDLAFILETPKDPEGADAMNIEYARKARKARKASEEKEVKEERL